MFKNVSFGFIMCPEGLFSTPEFIERESNEIPINYT